jgi:hypothetical protein
VISFFIFLKRQDWLWLSRAAETYSFLDYYNKVLCMEGLPYCYNCINITGKIHFKITFFIFLRIHPSQIFFNWMTYSNYHACSWHLFFVFGKSQVRDPPVLEGPYDILHISTKIFELLFNKAQLSLPSVQLLICITQSFRSRTHTLIKGRLV